jgi:lipopolysaccharide transport system ATP-binding protein
MHVRLGFAVAAHLEPEILVVDEVLAVGDAEFQKKCLGKMKTVSGEGRTVLFVSHNMGAIQSLCTSGIVMKNGTLDFAGNINDCVSQYLKMNSNSIEEDILLTEKGQGSGEALIKEIKLLNRTETNSNAVFYQSKIALKLKIESQVSSISINADVKICNKEGTVIFHALNLYYNQKLILEKGISYLLVEIENRLLPGFYIASIGIYNAHTLKTIDTHENILDFEVLKVSKIAKESYAFDWVVAPSILESNWQITNG